MKTIKEFDYLTPQGVSEAVSLISKYKEEARFIAGGTDLVPLMKDRVITPAYIIDIKRLSSLDFIRWDAKEGLRIGALTTIDDILKSDIIEQKYYSLHQAAESFATTQIRNMATIGGNICRSSPSADTVPPLIAFAAEVRLAGLEKERIVSLEDFFTGPATNVLDSELLVEIIVPIHKWPCGSAFKKVARTSEDLAKVNCAVTVTVSGTEFEDIRIALGGVAPTTIRAKNVEQALKGSKLDKQTIEEASKWVTQDISPITDCRSNVSYRIHVSKILIKRLIIEALKTLGEQYNE